MKENDFFCSSISRFSHFLHVSLGIEWVILWKKDIQVYGKPKLYDLVMICVAQIMFAKMILLSERRNKQTKKKAKPVEKNHTYMMIFISYTSKMSKNVPKTSNVELLLF